MRTLLAPGIEWREVDKSGYGPAMVGTNCYVMGFTDKGEPYVPMEFTSRAAWTNYYGQPDTEAERYAYAAACEVLNQNGRLYFARLPYDNAAFEQVAGFKYKLDTTKPPIGPDTPFFEVNAADNTIKNACAIEPATAVTLYDLSAVDEYRTDEAKVANNTFLIVDTAFNTYGKITEDDRKNERRELIGIMPVITTAANALYAQQLIDVKKENVIGYETIGKIVTLDAASKLTAYDASLSSLSAQTVRDYTYTDDHGYSTKVTDLAREVNTKDWYHNVTSIAIRKVASVDYDAMTFTTPEDAIAHYIMSDTGDVDSWDGSYQTEVSLTSQISTLSFSYKRAFTESELSADYPELYKQYGDRFGWHNPQGDDEVPMTVSREANTFFPTIDFDGDKFDRTNMKKIGVVVFKMFLDPAEGNKISFEAVESFAGSLCKTDRDPNTGVTTFIDTIINSQSQYINFFSNCFNTVADKKYYHDKCDILVVQPGSQHHKVIDLLVEYMRDFKTEINKVCDAAQISLADIITVDNIEIEITKLENAIIHGDDEVNDVLDTFTDQTVDNMRQRLYALADYLNKSMVADTVCPSLGFYSAMTKEDISISKSIYDGMNKCFDRVKNINDLDIDLLPDAGLANIASYLKAIYGDKGQYDLQVTDDAGNSLLGMWKCDTNNSAVKIWKTVEQKFDNFCKNVRKDCMFIADGPRPLVLAGQKKIVRPTKPTNSIDANIIPNLKWISGLNTSYGACYVNWFEQADDYSGDLFWCPPSIKAMGVYINTDVNYNYWDAPAGLNRGIIAATDVSFNPTLQQAGSFYEKNFNYAINYPQDGIALEGQKTLQVKPSAFDRVNVRRLFLRLERATYRVSRYFIYEGNTAYTRQRYLDAIDPYFKEAMNKGGIYDYKLICDETNNTDETIDRNELHVSVGIKPVKSIEWILIDFVCLRTGGSWAEVLT